MTNHKPVAATAGDKLVAGILADMAEHHLTPDAHEAALLDLCG